MGVRGLPGMGGRAKGVSLEIKFFFEDGLPPPTLNDSRPQPTDEDEPTRQPALGHTTGSDPPASTLPFTASVEATHDNGPTTTPHLCITVRLPRRLMKRPAVERRDESDEDEARRFVRPRLSCEVDAFRPHAQWRRGWW